MQKHVEEEGKKVSGEYKTTRYLHFHHMQVYDILWVEELVIFSGVNDRKFVMKFINSNNDTYKNTPKKF